MEKHQSTYEDTVGHCFGALWNWVGFTAAVFLDFFSRLSNNPASAWRFGALPGAVGTAEELLLTLSAP